MVCSLPFLSSFYVETVAVLASNTCWFMEAMGTWEAEAGMLYVILEACPVWAGPQSSCEFYGDC